MITTTAGRGESVASSSAHAAARATPVGMMRARLAVGQVADDWAEQKAGDAVTEQREPDADRAEREPLDQIQPEPGADAGGGAGPGTVSPTTSDVLPLRPGSRPSVALSPRRFTSANGPRGNPTSRPSWPWPDGASTCSGPSYATAVPSKRSPSGLLPRRHDPVTRRHFPWLDIKIGNLRDEVDGVVGGFRCLEASTTVSQIRSGPCMESRRCARQRRPHR